MTLTVSNPVTGAHDTVTHTIRVDPGVSVNPCHRLHRRATRQRQPGYSRSPASPPPPSRRSTRRPGSGRRSTGRTERRGTVGPFYGDLMSESSRSPAFEFLQPRRLSDNTARSPCTVWSPYLRTPIVVTKSVTVGPPLQANFTPNVTTGVVPAGPVPRHLPRRHRYLALGLRGREHGARARTRSTSTPPREPTRSRSRSRATTRRSRRARNEHGDGGDRRGGEQVIRTSRPIGQANPGSRSGSRTTRPATHHWVWSFGDGRPTRGSPRPTYTTTGNYPSR